MGCCSSRSADVVEPLRPHAFGAGPTLIVCAFADAQSSRWEPFGPPGLRLWSYGESGPSKAQAMELMRSICLPRFRPRGHPGDLFQARAVENGFRNVKLHHGDHEFMGSYVLQDQHLQGLDIEFNSVNKAVQYAAENHYTQVGVLILASPSAFPRTLVCPSWILCLLLVSAVTFTVSSSLGMFCIC